MKIKKNYRIYSLLDLPFLESDKKHIEEIFIILEQRFGLRKNSKQKLLDLGAGDGRIIIHAGLIYGILSIGYEINPDLIKEATEQIKLLKKQKIHKRSYFRKIKFKVGDIFQLNLKKFDYIYIYSLPTMQKFLNHVFKTAKDGAIFISYKYPLKNIKIILKLEYKIIHKDGNTSVETFFYRKI
jgi:SAM-dependent methyltransferase